MEYSTQQDNEPSIIQAKAKADIKSKEPETLVPYVSKKNGIFNDKYSRNNLLVTNCDGENKR